MTQIIPEVANPMTPLMKAAREGNAAAVAELIDAGEDINARNADGNNALWLAWCRFESGTNRCAAGYWN